MWSEGGWPVHPYLQPGIPQYGQYSDAALAAQGAAGVLGHEHVNREMLEAARFGGEMLQAERAQQLAGEAMHVRMMHEQQAAAAVMAASTRPAIAVASPIAAATPNSVKLSEPAKPETPAKQFPRWKHRPDSKCPTPGCPEFHVAEPRDDTVVEVHGSLSAAEVRAQCWLHGAFTGNGHFRLEFKVGRLAEAGIQIMTAVEVTREMDSIRMAGIAPTPTRALRNGEYIAPAAVPMANGWNLPPLKSAA